MPIDVATIRGRLAETPTTLRSLSAGLPPDALAHREAPGTWTQLEVLYHLTDAEVHDWIPRVRIIMSDGAEKAFTPFNREGGHERYKDWPAAIVVDEFERLRSHNLAVLADLAIRPEDLSREGIHPEFGRVTLGQLLACWVTHDLSHIAQISRVLVRYFGPEIGPWTAYFSLLRGR